MRGISPYTDELVSFTATVMTEAGQKILSTVTYSAQSPPTNPFSPSPLGLPNYAVWGPPLESGASGRNPGISNLGLLVTVWGKVVQTGCPDPSSCTYVGLDDGSGVRLRADLDPNYINDMPEVGDFVAITGVADVVYREYYNDTSLDGLDWPEGWCRRVVPCQDTQVVFIDQQNPAQGVARSSGTVTVNLQASEQVAAPVHVYTQYGHVVVEPNEWSGGSGSYSASCDLTGVPGDATHAGLLSVKAAGYASVSKWATPGSSVNVVLSGITGGDLVIADPDPAVLTCGGAMESSVSAMVRDAEGVCVPGEEVQWTVTNGVFTHNSLQTAVVVTDENGYSTVSVTPSTGKNMRVTASWNGMSAFETVRVAAERLSIWASPVLVSGGTATVYAKLTRDGAPVSYANITFAADAGGTVNGQASAIAQTGTDGIAQVAFAGDGSAEPKVTATFTNTCGWGNSVTLDASKGKSWPMFHGNIALTGVTEAAIPPDLVKKWEMPMAGDSSGTLWSSPVVADGWVYVGTNNPSGRLYAVKTDGTDDHWVDLSPGSSVSAIHGTPCVADGKVYVGTQDGVLHVLQAPALTSLWTKTFAGEQITGSATVYNGVVYVGTCNAYGILPGQLHAIDIQTQSELCGDEDVEYRKTKYDVDYTTPAIDIGLGAGRCYVSDYSCWVTAFGCADGRWQWQWAGDTASIYASPVVFDSYLFVGSHNNCVYRLSETTGTCEVAEAGSDCKYAGKFVTGGQVQSTAAALEGMIYFGCNDGKLYCVDANTMQQPSGWPIDLQSGAVVSSPLISSPNKLLFVAGANGKVLGVDVATGNIVWSYDLTDVQTENWTTASIRSSPAAAGSQLYIVAGDGTKRKLYCFGQ